MMEVRTYTGIAARVEADPYGADQVAQYRAGYAFPRDPDGLLYEAAWVVVGAGLKHDVARTVQARVNAALARGRPVNEVLGHRHKAAAIEHVRDNRDGLYRVLRAAHGAGDWELMLAHLSHIPFLGGPALRRHMAKNLGADIAKPDTHLKRIAHHCGESVDGLCRRLAAATGDRVAVVDVTLFLAAGPLGVITSNDPATWLAPGEGQAA